MRAAFVGAAIAVLMTLPGLGAGTLWDNSETAYGEVAREILLTHDWIVMHFNGAPWFVQPPLYFWIAAAFAHLFGVTSFALRLPSALATVLMGGLTGYAVSRQAGTRVGIYASVILSSCLMQAIIGRLAIMDALLDLTVALTIFWWFRGLEIGYARYFVYGTIAAALGFLVKGPVAPVIGLLVIVPYAAWNRRYEPTHLPSTRAWLISSVAAVAITIPWFVAIALHSGVRSVVELIGHYTFGRYTGVIENQAGPLWYYLPVVILGFFPWIAFIPSALTYAVRQLRMPEADARVTRLLRLGITWCVVPLLFFSFAKTKLPNYIALEFPALALITALYFDAVVRRGVSRSAIVSAASVPAFIAMVAFAIATFTRDNRITESAQSFIPDLFAMGIVIFVGSLLTAFLLLRRSTEGIAPYALAAATIVTIDILGVVALPHADLFKPVPKLASVIVRERKPGDVVAIQDFRGSNALAFYAGPGVRVLVAADAKNTDDGFDPKRVICGAQRVWVVASKYRPTFDPTYGRERRRIAEAGSGALFLYEGPACR